MSTEAMSRAQSRVMTALLGRIEAWAESTTALSQTQKAEVIAVNAGGAIDGTALCTIRWLGADVPVPYLSGYTPAVGHVVAVSRTGPQLLVLGRIVGTPPD